MEGGRVGDAGSDGKGTGAHRFFRSELISRLITFFESANGCADQNSGALTFGVFKWIAQTGVADGVLRGGDGKLRTTRHAPRFFVIHIFRGIESFNFSGDLAIESGGVKLSDAVDTTSAVAQPVPKFRDR